MRISKLYLVVCAAALGASIPNIRADDSPSQAAARAALEQQMQSMDAQPAPQNPPSAATKTPAQPAATAASTAPPPATNPPAAAVTTQAPAETNVPQTQPAVQSGNNLFGPVPPPSGGVPPSAIAAQTPTATNAPQTQPAAQSGKTLFGPVPPPSAAVPPSAIAAHTTSSSNAPTAVAMQTPVAPAPPGLKPIVAPPLPISTDQQAQLQALLQRYQAGAISPVEYQAERKKILNLPQ